MSSEPAPAVSVIIPAYGVTPYIAEALDSVFAQTFNDFELIVVNDGCPDSGALEAALRPYLDRIVYLKKENGGVSSARNAGIRVARAPLIALLDGDDAWTPDYLAVQTEFLREHPQTDIVYSNGVVFGDSPLAGRLGMDLSPSYGEVNFESLISCRCSVMTSVLARKAAILGVGAARGVFRPDAAGLDRTAIHSHARRFGQARQQEIPRHGLAGLVGFGRVVDVDPAYDHIRGPDDAPVTLLEYGDFECPYFGQAEGVIRELRDGKPFRHLRAVAGNRGT